MSGQLRMIFLFVLACGSQAANVDAHSCAADDGRCHHELLENVEGSDQLVELQAVNDMDMFLQTDAKSGKIMTEQTSITKAENDMDEFLQTDAKSEKMLTEQTTDPVEPTGGDPIEFLANLTGHTWLDLPQETLDQIGIAFQTATCGEGQYVDGLTQNEDNETFSPECSDCAQGCGECVGPTMLLCNKCSDNKFLFQSLHVDEPVCVTACPEGFKEFGASCAPTHSASAAALRQGLKSKSHRKPQRKPQMEATQEEQLVQVEQNSTSGCDALKTAGKWNTAANTCHNDCFTPINNYREPLCEVVSNIDDGLEIGSKTAEKAKKAGESETFFNTIGNMGLPVVSAIAKKVKPIMKDLKDKAEDAQKDIDAKREKLKPAVKVCGATDDLYGISQRMVDYLRLIDFVAVANCDTLPQRNFPEAMRKFTCQCTRDACGSSSKKNLLDDAKAACDTCASKLRGFSLKGPSFDMPSLSVPGTVEDMFDFVAKLMAEINIVLDHTFCINLGWFGRHCVKGRDVVNKLNALMGALERMIQIAVNKALEAAGISQAEIERWLNDQLGLLPDFDFAMPNLAVGAFDINVDWPQWAWPSTCASLALTLPVH